MKLDALTMMRCGGVLTTASAMIYAILSLDGIGSDRISFVFIMICGAGTGLYIYPVIAAMITKIIETTKWAKQEWNKKD